MYWWLENVESQKREIQSNNPDVILKSDASLEGWGAVEGNNKTGGRWTPTEQENHINCLELMAILYALKSFEKQLKKIEHIQILTDNTTAVAYINNMGGVKSQQYN